ncbi:hypothetical protein MOQ_008598 [Trypanosoma cruzi marinkellei]|uniref:Uncharacterized protein n=1 Tax=Trypanosoma cruzi marinkellei TaxID=85056 RepID=K2MKJ4_TRYCR|nr:hypothetical protein MOQ_008598 [Trypanosoma cruzi marinkellei]
MKASSDNEEGEVEKLLQRSSRPWHYFYPRARAHSSLLACYHAMGGLRMMLPQQLCGVFSRALSSWNVTNMDKMQNHEHKEIPLNVRLARRIYPCGQVPLVSDSTVGMMEAVLSYLRPSEGTPVFLPGMLLYPHYQLLELFDAWKLHVIGYDVEYVTMRVEEEDFRRKMRNICHRDQWNKDATKKGNNCIRECPGIVLLIGIGARFVTNNEKIVQIARNEFRGVTIELHPVTAASLWPENHKAGGADLHITCMDMAGEMGGAIAFTMDPLLANGISVRLEERPLPSGRRRWVSLARHISHLMVSDGMSFQLVLWVMQLWAVVAQKSRAKKKHHTAEGMQADGAVGVSSTVARANRIFEFLMSSGADCVHGGARSSETGRQRSASRCDQKNNNKDSIRSDVISDDHSLVSAFSQPHRGLLLWMMDAITSMQRRVEADCVSFWEFLSQLRNSVEVVSAGEPTTPRLCVASHSDSLLLRVRSPDVAAQALRTAGFDAVPAVTCVWDCRDRTGRERKGVVPTLREVIVLPDCPQSTALSQHALFLPLYTEMKWKNRQKLHQVMQTKFPSSLFCSPSTQFHLHVMSTPSRHAYRSAEVEALLRSWKQSCKDVNTFFADSQPLLLWALLGPIPGYFLSKL